MTSKAALKREIAALAYPKGKTATSAGINLVVTQIFGTAGDRPEVDNVLVLITDGTPTVPDQPDCLDAETAAINSAQAAQNVTMIFPVGITRGIDEELLKELSSGPQELNGNYFMSPSFEHLGEIRNQIREQVITETCFTTPQPGSSEYFL